MERPPPSTLAEQIAAAHDWWREAGVDLAYRDEPRGWLAAAEVDDADLASAPSAPAAPSVPEYRIGGDRSQWPEDLPAFARWWIESPALEAGPVRRRVPPRGPREAPLMILVPMPEAQDDDVLLSGPQGTLISNMVRAMGFSLDAIYLASALPRYVPLPDWGTFAAEGLGELVRHHVALAAPKRVLALGKDILPLLRHDPAQDAHAVSELGIQPADLPVMGSSAPGRLVDHPRLRAELWRQWLEWTGKS